MISDEGQIRAACIAREAADRMSRAADRMEETGRRIEQLFDASYGGIGAKLVETLETQGDKLIQLLEGAQGGCRVPGPVNYDEESKP